MENIDGFLKELAALTEKYKIVISGCGCCGSPRLYGPGVDKEGLGYVADLKEYRLNFHRDYDSVYWDEERSAWVSVDDDIGASDP